jgi:hypothetical protein
VTFVTPTRPELAAHPNRIENLHTARRGRDEPFRAKFREDAGYHFSHRPDTVREILLTHQHRESAAPRWTRCGEVEQMARDTLANGRERVARELFKRVIQSVHRLLRECPRERCVLVCRSFHTTHIEEERGAGRHGLHKHRRRPANERRNTKQVTGPYIPNGDLPAVAGMHVNAEKALQNDRQSFRVGFRVHDMPSREFDDAPALSQRFDRSSRQ